MFVPEGERHADTLAKLGLTATTSPMGAGKWRDEYAEHFRGVRQAVVLPDDDAPGREHAATVAGSLAPVVDDVRVLELWPRGESKADVLDFLKYATDEQMREQAKRLLVELANQAPTAADWIPSTPEFVSCHLGKEADRKRFFTASEIASLTPNAVPWMVKPWVAEGALTEVEGKIKAAGKTTFVLAMCPAALEGEPFMGEPTTPTPVVYLTEQPRTTFREGLRRAGLLERDDFSVLFRFDALDLSWPETVELAAQECVRVGAKLLVVDTLGPFAGLEGDGENSAGNAQAAIAPLQIVAQREKLAVVIVRHSRKGGGEVGESGRGSSAFGGAVDLMLSLRRRGGGAPKTQRIIHTLSRFDETPDDLVVDLVDGQYVALGSEDDSSRETIKASQLAVLADGSSLTDDELLEAVQSDLGEEAVKESTHRRARDEQLATDALHRVGQGKKGDPYRYQIEPDEFVSCQPPPSWATGPGRSARSVAPTGAFEPQAEDPRHQVGAERRPA